MSTRRQRAQWAELINTEWRKSVEAILACGRHLSDARASLGTEEFKKMVAHELVVGERTVERLLAIAADERLATNVSVLPASWGSLYALTRVPDPIFAEAIADKRINPSMMRWEAEELIPKPPPRAVTVAVHVEPPSEPPRVVPTAVHVEAYRPDQTPPAEPENQRERAVADALCDLAALIGDCDVEVLAALMRDRPEGLQQTQRVVRFMERLELALGGTSSALH